MTLAEWRGRYSGVQVQPYPNVPDVYMVSDRLLPGGPLKDLRELSDYWVTGEALEAHYGPTVFIAPRQPERDDWTRADYMDRRVSHETYYLSLARCIGLKAIASVVLSRIGDRDKLASALQQDGAFNGISLARWDSLDPTIRGYVSERNRSNGIMARSWCGQPLPPHTICWSLSETVCVTKAVARYLAQGGEL